MSHFIIILNIWSPICNGGMGQFKLQRWAANFNFLERKGGIRIIISRINLFIYLKQGWITTYKTSVRNKENFWDIGDHINHSSTFSHLEITDFNWFSWMPLENSIFISKLLNPQLSDNNWNKIMGKNKMGKLRIIEIKNVC